MKLSRLIKTPDYVPPVSIVGITADSRNIMPGFAFFAIRGNANDGKSYISDAVKHGAVAIIAESGTSIPETSVPIVYADDIRHVLAVAAANFYDCQPDIIAAVTGTSGKTSTVSFLQQIWTNTGSSAASIGTLGVISSQFVKKNSLTTPDAVEMHSVLGELFARGITHIALEASSHGILQRRLDGIELSVAAFTNLGHDHRDYHTTVEDYFYAKMRLFDTLLPRKAPAIVYTDDKYSNQAIEHIIKANREVLTVGLDGNFIRIKQIKHRKSGQYAKLEYDGKNYDIMLPLQGNFQIPNVVIAAGMAIATGGSATEIFEKTEQIKGVPGRLERVGMSNTGAAVYVDYAHKPDALENTLKSVRFFTSGRIILVFGCGGDRDRSKRSVMGEIANRLADLVIVTDDNPRTEDPASIRRQILERAPGALEEPCRRKAIYRAVSLLEAGDTLLVAGKGHEEGQIVGNSVLPFSDHVEIRAALEGQSK